MAENDEATKMPTFASFRELFFESQATDEQRHGEPDAGEAAGTDHVAPRDAPVPGSVAAPRLDSSKPSSESPPGAWPQRLIITLDR